MQPLTAKELEYIVDSMSNEDLLIKQCAATAAGTQNQTVRDLCNQLIPLHQQHYNALLHMLQQHSPIQPTSPQ